MAGLRWQGLPEERLPMILGCDAAGIDEDGRSAGPRELGDIIICPGQTEDIRWFEADPTYVLHFVNAYEDGDEIVLADADLLLDRRATDPCRRDGQGHQHHAEADQAAGHLHGVLVRPRAGDGGRQ